MRGSLKMVGLLALTSGLLLACSDDDSAAKGPAAGGPGFGGGGGKSGSAGTTSVAGAGGAKAGAGGAAAGAGGAAAGAGGASAGAAGSTAGAGGAKAGSGGSANKCVGTLDGSECGNCLEDKCCDSVSACLEDTDCSDCFTGKTTDGCSTNTLLKAVGTCQVESCKVDCTPASDCDPVTNAECTDPGAACDLNSDGAYTCFPDGNTQKRCEACNNADGPYCVGKTHCLGGGCTPFCKTDAECAGQGVCDTELLPGGVGLCVKEKGKGDSAEPACDSIITPPPVEPDCKAPATSKSGGACFKANTCNPVKGGDCKAGEACDYTTGGFKCYEPPNDAALCGKCDVGMGTFCADGMTCVEGTCVRFCCDDSDCSDEGTCAAEQGQDVGVCIKKTGGAGGAGGAGGSAGAGGSTAGASGEAGAANAGAGGAAAGAGGSDAGAGGSTAGAGGASAGAAGSLLGGAAGSLLGGSAGAN